VIPEKQHCMPQTFENQMTLDSVAVLPGDPLPGIQSIVLQQLCNSQGAAGVESKQPAMNREATSGM
jgi:hypothetical protein